MARAEARIFSAIWSQPDWRALSPDGQWVYMMLLSQSDLAQDGVISLRERRWAQMASGLTSEDITKALGELSAGSWVVVDEVTGELLIRSLIRWDRVYLQPNVMRAALAHLTTVESHKIRRAIYTELMRVIRENTDEVRVAQDLKPLTGEQKNVISKAVALLRSTGDALEDSDPSGNPSSNPSRKGSDMGSANPLGDRGKELGVDFEVDLSRARTREGVDLFGDPITVPPPRARSRFDEFWEVYPRREGKGAAEKAWVKATAKTSADLIIAAATRYRDDPNRDPAFTAHPSTWLNQGRWEDDPLPPRTPTPMPGKGAARTANNLAVVERLRQRRLEAEALQITGGPDDHRG